MEEPGVEPHSGKLPHRAEEDGLEETNGHQRQKSDEHPQEKPAAEQDGKMMLRQARSSATGSQKIIDDVAQTVEEIVRRVAAGESKEAHENTRPKGTSTNIDSEASDLISKTEDDKKESRPRKSSDSERDRDEKRKQANRHSSDEYEYDRHKTSKKNYSSDEYDYEYDKQKSHKKTRKSSDEYGKHKKSKKNDSSDEYDYEYDRNEEPKNKDGGNSDKASDRDIDPTKESIDQEPEEDDEDSPEIPEIIVSQYSDEELHSALDKLLKTGKMPDFEMRSAVVDYARHQSIYEVMKENYDRAAKIDKAVEDMIRTLNLDESNQTREQQTAILKEHLQSAQEQGKMLKIEYDKRISDFKVQENAKLDQLREQHECERREFELEWSRPETLSAFNKASPSLLYVRHMQKAFAVARDFEQAKRFKQAGDQMQREETKQANRNATEAMKTAYARLLAKQDREINCFMDNGYRKLATLESERDRSLKANQNLRNQLEAKIKEPRVARRPGVVTPMSASARCYVPKVITTRTRSQFANFKKAAERTSLDVRIKDVAKITQTMTMTPLNGKRKPIRFE